MVDDCFKLLRKNFRINGKLIIDHIKRNHFDPDNFTGEDDICSFCGKENELTREHVLPRWCFENDPGRYFETKINGTAQAFIKTTIPACATCNNETLAKVEKYINSLLQNTNLNTDYYDYEESLNIIRWLELIEYKFHVLNFRRKFRRKQSQNFIPIFRDVPMSVMRINIQLSPYKALSQLRESQTRIRRNEKDSRYYSLVFWKSKNKQLNSKNKQSLFFHTMGEHIFFEFPEHQMAMFYFFNKEFKSNYEAEKEALQIIMNNYGQNKSVPDNV